MTTIQITLPDQLAREAEKAGLLSPESIETWVRDLSRQRLERIFEAMDRMSAVDDPIYMSPEEIADDIRAMRAERPASMSAQPSIGS